MTKKTSDIIAQIIKWVVWAFIFVYSLTLLFLYVWSFIASLRNNLMFGEDVFGFSGFITFDNYVMVLRNFNVVIYLSSGPYTAYLVELLRNSLIYIVGCAVAATLAPTIVSYAVSQFNFKMNKVLDAIVIVTMVLPIIGSDAALITMTRTLGMYDNMLGMFFMKFHFLGFNYLLFKSAFKGVPRSYSESAYIDGASRFRVMVSINIPMVGNVIAIVFLIQLMGFWADWTTPMIYMPSSPTVAYALYELQFTNDPNLTPRVVQFAACIMASIPTILIYTFFRDKIMGGMAFGGLK